MGNKTVLRLFRGADLTLRQKRGVMVPMANTPDRPDNPPYDIFQDNEDDLLTAGGADPLDTGYSPPDEVPFDARLLLDGDDEDESLDSRLDRELPEVWESDPEEWDDSRAGRLVETTTEADRDLFGFDVGVDGGAAGAEEAAVHVIGDNQIDDDA
ncbi:MAG: DUF5709 domain-containing protein [Bifidobacteriaceae bacterium]|nr:DUF5709 domain-containing protein [Bifidobacteriaceae bacterium]